MPSRRTPPWLGLLALVLAQLAGVQALAEVAPAVHHEIRLRLDPDRRALRVEDRFTIERDGDIAFALAPWIELIEARVDGAIVGAARSGDRVRLPAPGRGRHQVDLTLRGIVPALPSPEARGAAPGGVAGAEGSFLPGAAGWLPVLPDRRIRYHLSVEVPAAYRAVASGRLVEERLDQGSYRAAFATERAGEMPAVFVGPYVIQERLAGDLRLRTYFHPELASLADDYLKVAAGRIRRYGDDIGGYPYADFHIVSAPLPVGLGFPNLTYVSRKILPLPFMRGRSLAHEILHNWWGNGVAVDYAAGNWAEGLTTYQADYALAEARGDAAAREMRLGWLRNLAALPRERDMAVARFVAKTHDAAQAVGYDKTAFIFHLLRREVGDAAFRAGLRGFWQARRFEVAAWADLQSAFERAAGRPLSWFFDQWLRRAGVPRIELSGVERRAAAGGHGVTLRLRQSAPAYRMGLPVVIETAGGPERTRLVLETLEQSFEIPLEGLPLSLHVDPDFETLRRLLPGESPPIFRDVTLSGKTVVVIPTSDPAAARSARRLAGRLLQRDFTSLPDDSPELADSPLLIIGLAQDIATFRARWRSSPVADLADSGSARAWTEERADGPPWLFVTADDAGSLDAVLRPLPHYRSQSYIVFDGAKAGRKGLWPAPASPLSHRFGAP